MIDVTGTCRYCGGSMTFRRWGLNGGDWDWVVKGATNLCTSSIGGVRRHYPVEPVEGIDY